ncbi:MAG: PIN domain-containing protein [Acidobacteriota bacterium]|nr:PIN domain-containing protein [Acidobacteriota bacterium]
MLIHFILVARLNPKDQWHKAALEIEPYLKDKRLVTSETVLIELLNYLAKFPPQMREAVAKFVKLALKNNIVEVVLHTHETFLEGLELYGNRLDKGYSSTDCISMLIMRKRGIQEVLTHDNHFKQEGFTILL